MDAHDDRSDITPTGQRNRRRRRVFGPVVKGVAALTLVGFAGFVGAVAWIAAEVGVEARDQFTHQPSVLFVSADGEAIAHKGDYRDRPVRRDELPDNLVDAVMAIEDRRFDDHFGFDPIGIVRAARANFHEGEISEGASTLTQQLAKRAYLTHDRTYTRKIKEILLAVWLEYQLDKDQILTRYLDAAYYGNGVHGIRAAARHYFGKEVRDLELSESVVLAGLLRAPARYSPTVNFPAASARARQVLRAMQEAGFITAEQAAETQPARPKGLRSDLPAGSYFADWVMSTMDDRMAGMDGEVQLHTSLDTRLQQAAERAVAAVLDAEGEKMNAGQAALVAMRPDGQVVAMVGGRDYQQSRFNRAVQARRQPGSSFKLFAYLAALRYGAKPDTRVVDEPIDIDGWQPANYGGKFRGAMTLEQAFARSVNTVAVQLSETVGPTEVVKAAHDLGIVSDLQPLHSTPLGTQGVSLLELTSAYAAVARGAYPVRATGMPFETDGGVRHRLPQREALDQLLRSVVSSGTGTAARLPIPAAGKTGTSQEYRDAWFIGYAGNLVVGVWVGNDDESPMNRVTGGSLPARIWKDFMMDALKGKAIDKPKEDDLLMVDLQEEDTSEETPAAFEQKLAEAERTASSSSSRSSSSRSSASRSSSRSTAAAAPVVPARVTSYAPRPKRVQPNYPFRKKSSAQVRVRAPSPASPDYRGGATRTYK